MTHIGPWRSFRKMGTVYAGILALAVSLNAVESGPYLPGVTPFTAALSFHQEKVFHQLENERKKAQLLYDSRTRNRILNVISDYKTGLKMDTHSKVPDIIFQESRKYGFDPLFLTAVIMTESSFYNWAKSRRGALGLMQIRPATGRALAYETERVWTGKPMLYDPGENIALGAYYLNKLIERFGDLRLALEAYNHGPSRIVRLLRKGKRPKRYSGKVLGLYQEIRDRSI